MKEQTYPIENTWNGMANSPMITSASAKLAIKKFVTDWNKMDFRIRNWEDRLKERERERAEAICVW